MAFRSTVLGLLLASVFLPHAAEAQKDELSVLEVPVFRNKDGYALALTAYETSTKAQLLKGEPAEHALELDAFLIPPMSKDVLCFRNRVVAAEAADKNGKNLVINKRKRDYNKYSAMLPYPDFMGKNNKPLQMVASQLDEIELTRPSTEIQKLALEVNAVIVKERASVEVDAVVADVYIDIGHGTEVKINGKKIDRRGQMYIEVMVKRGGGDKDAVIDSIYALDKAGKVLGGGRWTNELDLFNSRYEVELKFPLQDRTSATKLKIVLATKYSVEKVKFEIKDYFNK